MAHADVSSLREDYRRGTLERKDLLDSPLKQFELWLEAAIADELPEPNAMLVATVDAEQRPDARVVLLKGYDERGIVFYSNYDSAKGRQLAAKPYAAVVFNWLAHERQVRVRGTVTRISRAETAAYFHSRPKGSQIGAWASNQSQVIEDRTPLEQRKSALEAEYASAEELPVPDHWGGYRVAWEEVEFWQGRSSRLHDRFQFTKLSGGETAAWNIERLAP